LFVDPLIASPNAVSGVSDGSFANIQHAPKEGNFTDAFFLLSAEKVLLDGQQMLPLRAEKFCFANGITIKEKVYLAIPPAK